MPFVDYELTVGSRFVCPSPQSASPGQKHRHLLPMPYTVKTPHVAVDVTMGTRPAMVDRTDSNFYTGHVPDAPVLLGVLQRNAYARAIGQTGWSRQFCVAMGGAALAGAAIGILAIGGVMGIFAAAHHFGFAWGVAVSASDFLFGACLWGVGFGLMSLASDWRDWSRAQNMFKTLHGMANIVARWDCTIRRPEDEDASAAFVVSNRNSDNWVLQQASLELEAARDRIGYPVAMAAA